MVIPMVGRSLNLHLNVQDEEEAAKRLHRDNRLLFIFLTTFVIVKSEAMLLQCATSTSMWEHIHMYVLLHLLEYAISYLYKGFTLCESDLVDLSAISYILCLFKLTPAVKRMYGLQPSYASIRGSIDFNFLEWYQLSFLAY